MAIRDRFRRALRKSDSSDTISPTNSNTTTATTSETSSLHKSTSSKLARTFAFSRRSKDESHEESKRNKKNKKIHPSQRPLTLQNLKHQEMLSHFSMTFGASDPSQIESASFIGVSPCCTRAPSLEIDRAEISHSLTGSPNPDSVRD
ncbi:hypothetical protein X797_001900 [Metarhizium robertsii]|uniref:Uncharacterized protein n=2 Tax=Metarhizium robertsii TaxID=568076 RepID=E9F0G1_METRA|nr:uncharacterized protein MAA_05760 [Metarhizium robertsii ARSEF 23]EFY98621.1 hypothetical protein MAA_05760 [Metarhizium robertsii ARSEF 23]EXV04227.1 hypothetical protein X797_001900 [Metarhizium robertsii]